jgi:hypothetical protein
VWFSPADSHSQDSDHPHEERTRDAGRKLLIENEPWDKKKKEHRIRFGQREFELRGYCRKAMRCMVAVAGPLLVGSD